jgi:hypothetical protein
MVIAILAVLGGEVMWRFLTGWPVGPADEMAVSIHKQSKGINIDHMRANTEAGTS